MAKRTNNAKRIRTYMLKHPNHTPAQIADALGVTRGYVYQVQHHTRKKSAWTPPETLPVPPVPDVITMIEPKADPVNHPPHYKAGGIETIDFIEAKKLNYNLGNVVKYITRADLKGNRKQDLQKAAWYLQRELGGL
jgi:hypothetical protein